MPLQFAIWFLPSAALIAFVVMWPRRLASIGALRLMAEALLALLGVVAVAYGAVWALRWLP